MALIPASQVLKLKEKKIFKLKNCVICGNLFRPTSGKQLRCKACKNEKNIKLIPPENTLQIEKFSGYYINKQGMVFSLKNNSLKILKVSRNSTGFLTVKLYKNGKGKTVLIHKLVMQTFYNKYKNESIVFIDNNKNNVCLDNLKIK